MRSPFTPPPRTSPLLALGEASLAFTLGIDYGTNPVRALLVDVSNGRQLATCGVNDPSGKRGIPLDCRDAPLPPFPPVPFGTWRFFYALHRH
jgi:hypothetical protein